MAVCSLSTLIQQACDNGFMAAASDAVTSQALKLQLECNIAEGGGGGSLANAMQGFSADYSGGTPAPTPTTSVAMAIDSSNNEVWLWFGGAWHDTGMAPA